MGRREGTQIPHLLFLVQSIPPPQVSKKCIKGPKTTNRGPKPKLTFPTSVFILNHCRKIHDELHPTKTPKNKNKTTISFSQQQTN